MIARGVFAAFAALLVSASLVGNAHAYPTTARSGTTTVTGTYRPLDLNLQLASGNFFYDPSSPTQQTFALTGQLAGTFTSSYGASGNAGNWTLNLGFNDFNKNNYIGTTYPGAPILDSNVKDSNDGVDTITLGITASDRPVGTLVYNGGLLATSGALPVDGSDTPNGGDMFLLYAHNAGDVFVVTVNDIVNPSFFYLSLAQNLLHLGPYVEVDENLFALDDGTLSGGSSVSRVNEECDQGRGRCGSVPSSSFFITSVGGANVPEPASLALVGLGLAGLALVRRNQRLRRR